MQTPEAIVDRIRSKSRGLCFEPEVLVNFLTFDQAAPIRNEEATAEKWGEAAPLTREAVLAEAERYMREYGWPKCRGHRGISASRTTDKMKAWMWLIEDWEAVAFLEDDSNYAQYGAPMLHFLCKRFGWEIPKGRDVSNMVKGKPCRARCEDGCGR